MNYAELPECNDDRQYDQYKQQIQEEDMNPSPAHLQADQAPPFDEWYLELCKLYAEAEKIDISAVTRHIDVGQASEWYRDGFTPYVTFRENYK